ncbi:major facilitator superfamily domain-containing protein [Astrocystis sublimbata]|nr:major facilitator superfamily domain-containing protein [Astrocystis sublimbata]
MRDIGSRFHIDNANDLSASLGAYCIVLGASVLVAVRLGETFGHKCIFMAGLISSAVWSLIVGASFYSGQSLYLTARSLQGFGAALTLPTGLALLVATYASGTRKSAVITTIYAAMSPTGLLAGALGASVIGQVAWWPWVYWAFALKLVVIGIASHFFIPSISPARSPPSGARAATSKLDIPGMITALASLGVFGFAWGQAHVVGWRHGHIYVMLVVGAILAMAFVMIERWYAPTPLVPRSALSWGVIWVLIAMLSSWSCFGIWMFYGWQFAERLESASPLMTSAYFSPILVVGCFAVTVTQFVLGRFGPRAILCVAMLAMMLGSVLIATMPMEQTYWRQLFASTVFMVWGLYTSLPVAISMVIETVRNMDKDAATSLVWMAGYYGMGLGLALAGTIEHAVMSGELNRLSRLRGHKAAYWTSVGFAVFGLVFCLANYTPKCFVDQ